MKSLLITLSFVYGGYTHNITPLTLSYQDCQVLAHQIEKHSPKHYGINILTAYCEEIK